MSEKLNIELDGRQADALRRAAASGRYGGASDILGEALDDWLAKRETMSGDIAALRRFLKEGATNGETCPVDPAELLKSARRHFRDA